MSKTTMFSTILLLFEFVVVNVIGGCVGFNHIVPRFIRQRAVTVIYTRSLVSPSVSLRGDDPRFVNGDPVFNLKRKNTPWGTIVSGCIR